MSIHADDLAEAGGNGEEDPLKYSMYNSIVYVAAAFMLHYIKMKSVVTLTIENRLTKRSHQTTLKYFEGSGQAILLVEKVQNCNFEVKFQNQQARKLFELPENALLNLGQKIFTKMNNLQQVNQLVSTLQDEKASLAEILD